MVHTVFACLICCLIFSGCNQLTGGQARHETGDLTVSYDGVTIHDSREVIATTQPSIKSNNSQALRTETSREGEIGGVTFTELKGHNLGGSIAVASMFIGAGVIIGLILWITGQHTSALIVGVVAFAGAGLAFLYPWILGLAFIVTMLAAASYAAWSVWHMRHQLVAGAQNALAQVGPMDRERLKFAMSEQHDDSTKNAVAAVKPKLPRTPSVVVVAPQPQPPAPPVVVVEPPAAAEPAVTLPGDAAEVDLPRWPPQAGDRGDVT
jgi:hypothetical protein